MYSRSSNRGVSKMSEPTILVLCSSEVVPEAEELGGAPAAGDVWADPSKSARVEPSGGSLPGRRLGDMRPVQARTGCHCLYLYKQDSR